MPKRNADDFKNLDLPVVDRVFREYFAGGTSPGMVYAFGFRGEIMGCGAFGRRSFEPPAPVNGHTVFRIASMTKSFAAAAVLRLRDQGKLELDAPARAILPAVELHAALRRVTVRQLLGMRAGLVKDDPWADRLVGCTDAQFSEILAKAPRVIDAPGRVTSYSNLAYMLLGRIISTVAGCGSCDYITRHICRPLGLRHTSWNLTKANGTNFARGYERRDGGWTPLELLATRGDGAVFGALWSSPADVIRWTYFLSGGGESENEAQERILGSASRREMVEAATPYATESLEPVGGGTPISMDSFYGYGVRIARAGDKVFFNHSGGLPGFSSHMRWHRETQLAVTAFANATSAKIAAPCATALEYVVGAANG